MKITATYAPTLTASSIEDRTIRGLLLPFDEIGYTSVGPVTVAAGTVDISEPSVILNIEHDRRTLVGRSTTLEETDAGITAAFTIAATRAGDDALEEIKAGLRTCLSVELDDVEINNNGQVTAGRVVGAGLVLTPAFESARLAATRAGDDEAPDPDSSAVPVETTADPGDTTTTKETTMADAKVTADQAPALTASTSPSLDTLIGTITGAQRDPAMKAALSDIIPSAWSGQELPDYVGELWNGKTFQRRAIGRFAHKPLTSKKITGWRWLTKPQVGSYTGNKAAIPSGTIATEAVEIEATRIAGGHDIDRIFVDFESPEFWSAYYAAMTESYARLSDATVLTEIKDSATAVTRGTVPAGVSAGLVSIIDGVLSVLNETDTVPDTAFVSSDLWRDIMLTTNDNRLAYLDAALGFEEGTLAARSFAIIPESRLDAGTALVTARDAVTVHEFGNGVPIRVDAVDIARGGVDSAVFGYLAVNVHDDGGLALVTAGAAE